MSYQALYRAFRPDGFSGVVGQAPIVTTLVNQVKSGRVAHAYLFCGSRGTGKTSTAKVFARAINCQQPRENGDPCGACDVCRALALENNMDVIEIDAASNNGVDEIRELRDKIKYPPTIGRYKVYIVDEVHMLSAGAFNALLKTLEEPPAHAVFILATTEPQKLPATILSRCQRYDFKRIPAQDIIGKLRLELAALNRDAEAAALTEIARAAEGGMRDAESLLDMCLAYGEGTLTEALVLDVLGASGRASLFRFADALIAGDAKSALLLIDQQMQSGRDAQVFAREVAAHMRALLLGKIAPEDLQDLLELTGEDAERFIGQAAKTPTEQLMRFMDLFMEAEGGMRWASRPRAALELCAVRACHPEREAGAEALLARVAALEDKLKNGVPVSSVTAPAAEAAKPAEAGGRVVPPVPAPVSVAAPPKPVESAAPQSSASWDAAVEAVRKNSPGLYHPMAALKCLGEEGGVVRLALPKKWNMYLGVLTNDAKKQLLEQAVSAAYGRPMRTQITLEDETKKPVVAQRDVLDQVYDLFGRENVSVLDDE